MQVSFNAYRPYTQSYGKINNNHTKQQNLHPNFTSGYGCEEIVPVDNPDLPLNSESERWRNIGIGIKQMTVDAYRESHGIYPKKKPLLFTPEELAAKKASFYKDTDFEDVPLEERLPQKKPEVVEEIDPMALFDEMMEDELDAYY